jgi:3-oxoacyl-[acyl-carrier-protein] synthase-3
MGARIESFATSHARGILGKGALGLADAAAESCLEKAGRKSSDVELLVNAGIYREKNVGEPALAALIQEDIGANPGHPQAGAHGTFSFDVANGGCGVITAALLLSGFLRSRTIELGLVVASDSDPGHSRGFEFPAAGGALLLDWAPNDDRGFLDFQLDTFPEHAELSTSRVRWTEHEASWVPHLHPGENVLYVENHVALPEQAAACAARSVEKLLGRNGLAMGDVDLVVPSIAPVAFPSRIADALGIGIDRVASAPVELAGALTAGPVLALERACDDGRFQAAHNTLFVTVGAGISTAVALYRGV